MRKGRDVTCTHTHTHGPRKFPVMLAYFFVNSNLAEQGSGESSSCVYIPLRGRASNSLSAAVFLSSFIMIIFFVNVVSSSLRKS